MKDKITQAVKTSYSKYGLKAASVEKMVTIIEAKLTAMGVIEPDKLQDAISEAIKGAEPFVELIQSEVDSRITKPNPPAPVINPSPAPAENETATLLKTLMEKITGLENKDAEHRKATTKQELISNAKKKASESGATNQEMLNDAMRLINIDEGMTDDQASQLAIKEYNRMQSSYSKDGAVPIIPALGDKATVDAAQAKGVALVDKFLGKPKA